MATFLELIIFFFLFQIIGHYFSGRCQIEEQNWVQLVRILIKMTMQSVSVLLYTTNEYTTEQCFEGITSEELCMKLCVKLEITPATSLLFALRISGTKFFIPVGQTISSKTQYEFRLRFEVCLIYWKCCFTCTH